MRSPSSITSDLGVASRNILQLSAISKRAENNGGSLPFVKLNLERTGVREHVVIGTHAGENGIHWTESGLAQ